MRGCLMRGPTVLGLLAILLAGQAQAGPHCDAPLSRWQTREMLEARAAGWGWTVRRIRIDDGCYEVEGRDRAGRAIEAKVEPETLKILEQEIEDEHRPSHRPREAHED